MQLLNSARRVEGSYLRVIGGSCANARLLPRPRIRNQPRFAGKRYLEVQIEDDRYIFELMSGGRVSDADMGPPPDIAVRTDVDRHTGVPWIEIFVPKRL